MHTYFCLKLHNHPALVNLKDANLPGTYLSEMLEADYTSGSLEPSAFRQP